MVGLTLVLAVLAALPTFWPETFPSLNGVRVDTDPENMLPKDEPARVFHDRMKEVFSLHDMIVLGVVNDEHEHGVFNPQSLEKIYRLTEYAKTLRWPSEINGEETVGVVVNDLIAPSTVDNIKQGGLGQVRFEWLMKKPPETQEAALTIRDDARNIPFLNGTLVSEDGLAVALYIPLTSKDLSYKVSQKLEEKIAEFDGPERFLVTGLPVAEDTFGVQMFKQMAISAPLAMLVIFVMMLLFFHKVILTLPSVLLAVVCAIQTMSLLVISGNTIHIMSSMIPIFIIPIQVLDDIHVISEFFDRYRQVGDREETLMEVMETLFWPLLFTSLTTTAGFASLALTPIPPVQVFGIFVSIGVMLAWVWTLTFIPAAIMLFPERWLKDLAEKEKEGIDARPGLLSRFLHTIGRGTHHRPWMVLTTLLILIVVAVYGITKIQVNDNPTKWFEREHPIRVADRILNEHFGGTYMAYLTFAYAPEEQGLKSYADQLAERLNERGKALEEVAGSRKVFSTLAQNANEWVERVDSKDALLKRLSEFADRRYDEVAWEEAQSWEEAALFLDREQLRDQVFKQPAVLTYVDELQQAMGETQVVGKVNTLADIVKTVHRELFLGKPEAFTIPDSADAVAQTLITFQNSHRPQDLWHLVTPDYERASLWYQLKSGDNQDMQRLAEAVEDYLSQKEAPVRLDADWFGLTYINVVWQDKMVSGMIEAFLGSFLVVLLMMIFLYRSALWAVLSMIPLLATIGLIYGAIGLIGKDYDMPVAVLSSLSLGLAVDYAIHFLSRSREIRAKTGSWKEAIDKVFGEPARAISRNVIVVGVAFLPLLFAPLVPYQTVGIFIAAILFTAGVASLFVLPAAISLLEGWLFPASEKRKSTCKLGTGVVAAVTAAALVIVNVRQFLDVGWTEITWISVGVIGVMMLSCWLTSKRRSCRS
jgi:hypothetical protein